MARSRRPVPNPSIPRLEWVAKTYPDAVWILTVFGFMEAAAMDDARTIMEYEAEAVVDMDQGGESITYSGFLSDGVAYQIREYGAENTEYDRYIPWLAKSLNRVTKKPVKKLREVFEKAYPGLLLDRDLPHVVKRMAEDDELLSKVGKKVDRKESDPTPILVDAFTVTHGAAGDGVNDAWYHLDEPAYTEAEGLIGLILGGVQELISSFGTVVRWAEGAGVDLDDYEPLEAVELAKEWAARQPKDPSIVAGDVVYEFDDGWTFQELTTRPQFMCEGKYLDHCVKGYKPSKVGVVYRIFSLRDLQGRPVATLRWEIDGEYVSQYYGMSNETPEKDEVERAAEFRRNYIDENLVSSGNKLERLSPDAEQFPALAGEFEGEFLGAVQFRGRPDEAIAVYDTGFQEILLPTRAIDTFVELLEEEAEKEHGEAAVEKVREQVLSTVRKTPAESIPVVDWMVDEGLGDSFPWELWKQIGVQFPRDHLVNLISAYELPHEPASNPRKRRKAKRKATPEYKRLLDRSRRLWETYDAKPLKKNLVAFGTHVERMEKSSSLKVKTEARRAARAFNAEFRARGWKK